MSGLLELSPTEGLKKGAGQLLLAPPGFLQGFTLDTLPPYPTTTPKAPSAASPVASSFLQSLLCSRGPQGHPPQTWGSICSGLEKSDPASPELGWSDTG